ncbi:GNAT family N-acetyltransferase [Rheinheimera baltica]|uniref:GNAT family N-acetyltransferase n=1 Tax=Rheinheimera baltica TaxID=67576 RepID=A0ABT9HXZ9_9GAMM|nr:GNAT family N-acetyltransferase [Rheinheimera baltica]MDP5135556.1 GNAT family N-acetyltransferase [Rheinheimera baltica]MDP5143372.1 GNAT family N-acetyltransferase [Rheinheimera baltica]MDP5151209.1 GNAT family N-acetyltransferase [Rheinheimera baltica]MDP5191310.1 GNAT family N-acetyltransferase [Rheinheimera baltica]
MLNISLRDVNHENYEAVCELDVTKQQEPFVACNMWSLVEAAYNDGHTCRAIYQGDQPVGFFMWVKETPELISIWRFMVDKQFQHQGIGRKAMTLALAQIKQDTDIKQIEICYNPQNPVAKNFYGSFGFIEQGLDDEGEDMLASITLKAV